MDTREKYLLHQRIFIYICKYLKSCICLEIHISCNCNYYPLVYENPKLERKTVSYCYYYCGVIFLIWKSAVALDRVMAMMMIMMMAMMMTMIMMAMMMIEIVILGWLSQLVRTVVGGKADIQTNDRRWKIKKPPAVIDGQTAWWRMITSLLHIEVIAGDQWIVMMMIVVFWIILIFLIMANKTYF